MSSRTSDRDPDDASSRARLRAAVPAALLSALVLSAPGLTMFDLGPERLRDLPAELRAVRPAAAHRVMRERLMVAPAATVLLQPTDTGQSAPVYLELQHDAEELEVRVNGVPVTALAPGRPTYFLRLSGFLAEGMNEVTVRWRSAAKPRRPLSVEVLAWPRGRGREEAKVLVSDTVDPASGARERSRTWSFEVTSVSELPWHEARPVTELTSADREGLLSRVRNLHDAVAERSPERLLEQVGLALRAMSGGDTDAVERVASHYHELMESSDFEPLPVEEERLRLQAHGRLTVVWLPGGAVLGASETSAGRLEMRRLFFANIDGCWELVAMT